MSALGIFLLALLGASAGQAGPSMALDPFSKTIWNDAERLEERGDYSAAALRYEALAEAKPEFTQAVLALGRVWIAAGEFDKAEGAYSRTPYEPEVVEAMGRLYMLQGRRLEAAELFKGLQSSGWSELWLLEARARAVDEPRKAIEVFRQFVQFEDVSVEDEAVLDVVVEIAESLIEHEDLAEAQALLEWMIAVSPAEDARVTTFLDRVYMEEQARLLVRASPQVLTGVERESLRRARGMLLAGELDAASAVLSPLVEQKSMSPEVQALNAETLERLGNIEGAERAFRLAEALAPLDARHSARLGDFLSTYYAGRLDYEALAAYQRSLRMDPTRADIWYRKGKIELRVEKLDEAKASFQRYQRLAPEGEYTPQVNRDLNGLDRESVGLGELSGERACGGSISAEDCHAYYLALAYYTRGAHAEETDDVGQDREMALKELAQVRVAEPMFLPALNMEAAIYLAMAESDGGDVRHRVVARELYEESIRQNPDQPDVLTLLGVLAEWRDESELAQDYWLSASQMDGTGAASAHFYLARVASNNWQWWSARHHLRQYFEGATNDVDYERAKHLRDEVERPIRLALAGGVGFGLLAVGFPLWFLLRRRTGTDVLTLLEAAPGCYPEVVRICSTIRHEVIKHNVALLENWPVGEGEGGDERAFMSQRLFGEHGAVPRFHAYIEELEGVAKNHGVRLNLRRRDAVFGPMIAAMERLWRMRNSLSSGRARWTEVDDLSTQLNGQSYRSLGRLISNACLMGVEADPLAELWERLIREPGLEGSERLEFSYQLPQETPLFRMYRRPLEDILSNLLRNSATASMNAGTCRVGVRVECEEDFITGMERVAIRVCDDAPGLFDTAMIRSRTIERGLGLAVDTVSQHGGSIHVEDEQGWVKAVVVRLPRVEKAEETDR